MKKLWVLFALALLLTGCGAKDYEGVADVYAPEALPAARELLVSLPPDAAAMESGDGQLWLCDGYTVSSLTRPSGDLDATLRAVTGYGREQLEVLSWEHDGLTRYACVWVSAGEGGDQLARTEVLDDGAYHYCLTLQAEADRAGALQETWGNMLDTLSLNIVP